MLRPRARKGWLASTLGTLIAAFLVVASVFAWVYVRRELGIDAPRSPETQTIGTSGQRLHENSPGGSDPGPEHSRTRDELKFRGVGEPKKAPAMGLTAKEPKEK